ncbi:MAG: porin family protein [Bacteroidota bacterium]
MKKLIVSIIVAVVSLNTIQAQDFTFGAKAGLSLSTLQPELTASRTSFHLGGVAEISISDQFSVQPELLYSGQGAKDQNDIDDNEIYRLDYLSVPIMAKYYIVEGVSVEAGPQFGILLSAEREDNGETGDIKDVTKSTDLGLAFGLGYKMDNGLNFGLRYFLGGDVNDIDEDSDEFKNRVFQISVGYFFN